MVGGNAKQAWVQSAYRPFRAPATATATAAGFGSTRFLTLPSPTFNFSRFLTLDFFSTLSHSFFNFTKSNFPTLSHSFFNFTKSNFQL